VSWESGSPPERWGVRKKTENKNESFSADPHSSYKRSIALNRSIEARNHESDDQLELYALDRLSAADLIRVEDHLIVCEDCRERLEETAAFAFAVRDALKQNPVKVLNSSPASKWFGWLRMESLNIAWKPQFAAAGFAVVVLATGAYFSATRNAGTMPAPVASLQLTAMRGEIQNIPASQQLDLTLLDSPATGGPFRMEVVNETGKSQWTGIPNAGQTGLSAHISRPFPPGVYFARLYDSSGKLLHEYGFRTVSQ
jgi:hypothetical protein